MASRWDTAPADGGITDAQQEGEAEQRAAALTEEQDREELWRTFGCAAKAFAHVEGWDAVLNAIARAMREEARERGGTDATA